MLMTPMQLCPEWKMAGYILRHVVASDAPMLDNGITGGANTSQMRQGVPSNPCVLWPAWRVLDI